MPEGTGASGRIFEVMKPQEEKIELPKDFVLKCEVCGKTIFEAGKLFPVFPAADPPLYRCPDHPQKDVNWEAGHV
jgi:hypothetical protein